MCVSVSLQTLAHARTFHWSCLDGQRGPEAMTVDTPRLETCSEAGLGQRAQVSGLVSWLPGHPALATHCPPRTFPRRCRPLACPRLTPPSQFCHMHPHCSRGKGGFAAHSTPFLKKNWAGGRKGVGAQLCDVGEEHQPSNCKSIHAAHALGHALSSVR